MGHSYSDRKIRKLRHEHMKRLAGKRRQAADYAGVPLGHFFRRGITHLNVHCLNFGDPANTQERRIKSLIDEYRAKTTVTAEKELFAQTKRLADAERKLKDKETKVALENARIATDKISKLKTRLADLKRKELGLNTLKLSSCASGAVSDT